MKQISQPKFIDIKASDFAGLDTRALQQKARKISTVDLSEPTSLEDLFLELHVERSWSVSPRLSAVFFGKDVHSNEEIYWACAIEPYHVNKKILTVRASEELINKWNEFSNGETLIVERVGFASIDDISFTAVVKVEELIDGGFRDMYGN